MMKANHVPFLLLAMLALMVGGCTSQPPAKAQAETDTEFILKTGLDDGRMVFVGAGGEIDGKTNPDLEVHQGDAVHIVFINDDGMPHDLAIPDLNVHTSPTASKNQKVEVTFEVSEAGIYVYYCTVAGHRQAGMEGKLVITEP